MKKIAVVLMMLVLLTGCYQGETNTESTPKTTVTVTAPVDDTVNGYKIPITDEEIEGAYVANQKTKKFHKDNCTYAKSIGADNKYTTDSRQQLIGDGYLPCKKCNP